MIWIKPNDYEMITTYNKYDMIGTDNKLIFVSKLHMYLYKIVRFINQLCSFDHLCKW